MIYFVDSNAAPGTVGTPFPNAPMWNSTGDLDATVKHVINNPSRGGDEIWALGGPYYLTAPLVINNNKEPLSIYGGFKGGENTLCERDANIRSLNPNFFPNASILDGGGNRVINMQFASDCLIDGFAIRNGNAGTGALSDGGGIYVTDLHNVQFENLVIMGNTAGSRGGGMYVHKANALIKNTIFLNNTASNGGGLYVDECDYTTAVNLLFYDNQSAGTGGNGNAIYVNFSGIGIFSGAGSINNSIKIINNTIANNFPASAASVFCNNSDVDIFNSILFPDTLAAVGGGNLNIDYCLLNNDIRPFANPNINNQNGFMPPLNPVNPLFVNPAAGDYHLQPSSLCIDRGNIFYIFPLSATDLEGKPRFINNGATPSPFPNRIVDMGAFEVQ